MHPLLTVLGCQGQGGSRGCRCEPICFHACQLSTLEIEVQLGAVTPKVPRDSQSDCRIREPPRGCRL